MFPVLEDAKCTDRNLIYALICNKCELTVYVGETERTLKERVEEHKRDVKYQRNKPMMKHFENHDEKDLHVAVMAKTVGETIRSEEGWPTAGREARSQSLEVLMVWLRTFMRCEP